MPRPAISKPAGVPLNDLCQVILQPYELEALRLADLRGLTQAQAASKMGISRSTFQRIVARARRQVAQALVEGSALRLTDSIMDAKVGVLRKRVGQLN